MALLILISVVLLMLLVGRRHKNHVAPKRTERQEQVDELITVILPTIRNER